MTPRQCFMSYTLPCFVIPHQHFVSYIFLCFTKPRRHFSFSTNFPVFRNTWTYFLVLSYLTTTSFRTYFSVSQNLGATFHFPQISLCFPIPGPICFVSVQGCISFPVPESGWMERTGQVVEMGCDGTSNTWKLHCKDNKWVGTIGNCSHYPSQPRSGRCTQCD